MKEDLTLNIGTKYKGDGFKKVDQSLKNTAKTVNTASRAIGAISSELGQMEGAVGKAAGAFSGLISTIATGGGPIGLAIAGITAAIALVVKAFNDAKEAAKEAAQTMRESFTSAIDAMSGRLRGLEDMFASIRKWRSEGISNTQQSFDLDTRRQKAEQNIQYHNQREGMTSDYDKARSKAEQSYNQGMLETNETVSKTRAKTIEMEESLDAVSQEIEEMRSEIADMQHKASQQFVATVDADLAREFKTLQDNLSRAEEMALRHGKNAVARTEKQTMHIGSGVTGAGYYKEVEYKITYGVELENAARKLSEFKKKNEESIKSLDAYNKTVEKIEEAQKKVIAKEEERVNIATKLELAQKEEETVAKELEAQRKKLEETYKEQIEAIDKQEQAEKQAKEKERKAIEEKAKKEKEKAEAAEKEKARQAKVNALENERDKIAAQDKQTAVQRLEAHKKEAEAAKELSDAERKAAGVMAQWAANPQQNFAKWNQQQNKAQREQEKQQKQQGKNEDLAKKEAERLAKRLFKNNGELHRGANAFDIGRFAEMSDFLGFKNVDQDQLDTMQKEREKLRNKLFNEDGTVKRGVAENGKEMTTFKKLDKALKNVDAVKDAEKKRKEAEDREKKRAENEDKRTASLSKIQEELKKLTEKAGI